MSTSVLYMVTSATAVVGLDKFITLLPVSGVCFNVLFEMFVV